MTEVFSKGKSSDMGPVIKIAICDDEADCRESMEVVCRTFFEEKNHSVGMPEIHLFHRERK